jgi:cytochrome c oxidase subunit I
MRKKHKVVLNWRVRPYNLLLALGLIFLCEIPFLRSRKMDLHFHDTYLIIGSTLLPAIAALISILIWLTYRITQRRLRSIRLMWFHVAITGVFLLLLGSSPFIYGQLYNGFAGRPRRYYDFWTIERYHNPIYFGDLIFFLLSAIIFIQFLFVLIFGIRSFKNLR